MECCCQLRWCLVHDIGTMGSLYAGAHIGCCAAFYDLLDEDLTIALVLL